MRRPQRLGGDLGRRRRSARLRLKVSSQRASGLRQAAVRRVADQQAAEGGADGADGQPHCEHALRRAAAAEVHAVRMHAGEFAGRDAAQPLERRGGRSAATQEALRKREQGGRLQHRAHRRRGRDVLPREEPNHCSTLSGTPLARKAARKEGARILGAKGAKNERPGLRARPW